MHLITRATAKQWCWLTITNTGTRAQQQHEGRKIAIPAAVFVQIHLVLSDGKIWSELLFFFSIIYKKTTLRASTMLPNGLRKETGLGINPRARACITLLYCPEKCNNWRLFCGVYCELMPTHFADDSSLGEGEGHRTQWPKKRRGGNAYLCHNLFYT